jgi:3-deoxy-D-manno-octulosonic-acid transferase
VHASSIGETSAALALIDRIGAQGLSLVLTTNALAGFQLAESRLGERMVHQYAPIDTPVPVDRFLDHWRPDLALFVESELWPTTLDGLTRRGTPLVLVTARMSERAFRDWRRLGPIARAVSSKLELVLAQSESDAGRYRQLGAEAVRVCGNLKFDVPPPACDAAALRQVRAAIGSRQVFLAASTHPGEETAVLSAHAALLRSGAKPLTIIAPRHPRRGAKLAAEAQSAGLSVALRSLGQPIAAATDVYIADTVGEMGLWYRVADLTFLGGSLVPRGGQNPIEPAQLGAAVLHGPYIGNFREIYAALDGAKAASSLRDTALLAETVRQLLADRAERLGMAERARACVARFKGALDRTMEALEPYVARLQAQRCG